MSSETTDKFPVNIKRRGVGAVRYFPSGCGTQEVSVSSLNDSANHRAVNVAKSEIPRESLSSFEGVKSNDVLVEEEEEEEEEECVNGHVMVEEGVLCDFEKFVLSKRRKVPDFQVFPVGCVMGFFDVGKRPLGSAESKLFDNEMEVGLTASSRGKALNVVRMDSDNGKGSTVSEREELMGETIQETKDEGISKSSKVTCLSGGKSNFDKKLGGEVDIPYELSEELRISNMNDSQKYQLENDAKSEAFVLPNESLGSFEHLEEETHNLKKQAIEDVGEEGNLTEFEKFILSKRRVSAVRDFPFGCGSCASKPRKGSVASSKGKVFDDVKEVGLIAFSKRKALDEPRMEGDKSKCSIVGKVEGLIGAGIVRSSKVMTSSGEKKNPATRLEGEVKRNDLNRMQLKVKQLSRAATFKSAKMRSWDVEMMHATMQREVIKGSMMISDVKQNDRDRIRENAQGSNSEVRAKSLPKGSLSKNIVEENRGKKLLIRSSSEKKLENRDVQRVGKNLQDKVSGDVNRDRVKKVLRRFRLITRTLLEDEEKSKGKLLLGKESDSKDCDKLRRVDLKAARILKDHNEWVNQGEPIIGNVPGVEVGDEFHYRVEVSIIGVHHPYQSGIDYTKRRGMLLATSVVASGSYHDDVDNSDVLIYSGSGGNAMGSGDKQVRDQKLERGNLALKNSIDAQTPVRVIYGSKVLSKRNVTPKMVSTFTYDGLYLVEKYWRERGNNNFIVFKFLLRRMPGQPKVR